jgi:hypothetical protein
MKTKVFLLAVFATATLIIFSFTGATKNSSDKAPTNVAQEDFSAPAGGFGLERI